MDSDDIIHLRDCLIYFFDRNKTATEAKEILCQTYGEGVISQTTCDKWYQRFRNGDFDVSDRRRTGRPRGLNDNDLRKMIDQNPTITSEMLAEKFGVNLSTIGRRLSEMGKMRKNGKWVSRQPNVSKKNNVKK